MKKPALARLLEETVCVSERVTSPSLSTPMMTAPNRNRGDNLTGASHYEDTDPALRAHPPRGF